PIECLWEDGGPPIGCQWVGAAHGAAPYGKRRAARACGKRPGGLRPRGWGKRGQRPLRESAFAEYRRRRSGRPSAAVGPVGPAALPAGAEPPGSVAASRSQPKAGASRRRAQRAASRNVDPALPHSTSYFGLAAARRKYQSLFGQEILYERGPGSGRYAQGRLRSDVG